MDRLIYTAMSGANASAQRQAVLSNNLANASTTGFRAEMATFRAVPVQGDGASTRVFAHEATAGYLDKAGSVQRTGRALDAMAKDNAWFAVQSLDGTEAYSRNGAMDVATDGTLVNSNGLPVLSDGGAPLTAPPGAEISLGSDGIVSVKLAGQPPTTLGRLKLVRPTVEDPLRRGADGLFRAASGEPLNADPTAKLVPGALEASNVNPVETMVGMIQVARQFEVQMRMLQNAEANDKSASQLLASRA
jgi:flagellar basal-body rod protein FlgF